MENYGQTDINPNFPPVSPLPSIISQKENIVYASIIDFILGFSAGLRVD